jgi:tRNA 2-thiocytidine biosynthesis protein TtcA
METFFLNMFFGGKLKGMPAKLQSDDGRHIVIRPLAYVKEADTERYAKVKDFPIIPCNLCVSQENLQRKHVKQLMREWDKQHPGRVDNIFSALSTVVPSHLMDKDLFNFRDLKLTGEAVPNGDIAFDEEPCSTPTTGVIQLQLDQDD